jgi:hypothetical protein
LLIGFQSNLNDAQKKKLTKMISEKVKKWDWVKDFNILLNFRLSMKDAVKKR